MIVTNLKELSASKKRLFRKKRRQLMKKINLKRIKNGVYLLPFENPEPSGNEIKAFEQIEGLTRELSVKANYFAVTQVEPEHLLEGDPTEIMWENYFVLKPIKILDTS